MAATKKKLRDVKNDPRVQEMAAVLLFVMNNSPNKMLMDEKTFKTDTLHDWCRRVLTEAGYKLKDNAP